MVRFASRIVAVLLVVVVILVCSGFVTEIIFFGHFETSSSQSLQQQPIKLYIDTIGAKTTISEVSQTVVENISLIDGESSNASNLEIKLQSLTASISNEPARIVSLSKVGSLHVINKPGKTTRRYAVTCCYVQNADYNYVFGLPMAVLNWSRAGFGTIIILIGKINDWLNNPVLNTAMTALIDTNATIVFLPSKPSYSVMISQVARLFVSKICPWHSMEDTYIIITDSDLWPINMTLYDLPKTKQILSLNSECCKNFEHKGQKFKMLPMCNIGMTVKMWRSVMRFPNDDIIQDAQEIVDYFKMEFGEIVDKPVKKGGNKGWYLDQMMISIRIFQWTEIHGSSMVNYIPRNTLRDRIDRARWAWTSSDNRTNNTLDYRHLDGKNDAHILENSYRSGVWERLFPLLAVLLTNEQCHYLQQYRSRFLRATERMKQNI